MPKENESLQQMHQIPLLEPDFTVAHAAETLIEEVDGFLSLQSRLGEEASGVQELTQKRIGQRVLSYINVENLVAAGVGVMNMVGYTSGALSAAITQVTTRRTNQE